MTRVVICGSCGRMGAEVVRLLSEQKDVEIVGGVEAFGHPLAGTPLGKGMVVFDLATFLDQADVVVDFSTPDATCAYAELCAATGKPLITGVTGLSEDQTSVLRACAARIPLVHAPNFSVGVACLRRLVSEAARLLGPDFDVEIVETHHRRKRDAPSGTAKLLVKAVEDARKGSNVVCGRKGQTGQKPLSEIGVSSVRTGDVVGEHTVVFGGTGERVELRHKAESRAAFAAGVLAAVRFIPGRKPGLYSIDDVLAG
jgi:4-hydroxy-tetrahydrodipicolinate reductase